MSAGRVAGECPGIVLPSYFYASIRTIPYVSAWLARTSAPGNALLRTQTYLYERRVTSLLNRRLPVRVRQGAPKTAGQRPHGRASDNLYWWQYDRLWCAGDMPWKKYLVKYQQSGRQASFCRRSCRSFRCHSRQRIWWVVRSKNYLICWGVS